MERYYDRVSDALIINKWPYENSGWHYELSDILNWAALWMATLWQWPDFFLATSRSLGLSKIELPKHHKTVFFFILFPFYSVKKNSISIVNRPGEAGLFYKPLCHWFSHHSFSSKSSTNLHSKVVRARELKFWENV